jgi:hypothetical protein
MVVVLVPEILVWDTGIGLDHALWLGYLNDNPVYYYREWHEPFPRIEHGVTGEGFTEIKHVDDWGEVLDRVDYVVFTDSGFGSLNDYLRKNGSMFSGIVSKWKG